MPNSEPPPGRHSMTYILLLLRRWRNFFELAELASDSEHRRCGNGYDRHNRDRRRSGQDKRKIRIVEERRYHQDTVRRYQ